VHCCYVIGYLKQSVNGYINICAAEDLRYEPDAAENAGREEAKFVKIIIFNNQPDALIIQIYSVIKFYMFWASSLSLIKSSLLYIRHW